MSGSMRWRRRALLGAIVIASSALLSACLSSTAPQPSEINLNGTWNYTGEQTVPIRETLSGKLVISRESGNSFQGRVDLFGVNAQTQQTRVLGGLMSGAATGTNVIDFDFNADPEATPRRHVGQILADTIKGTWVGCSTDGTTCSGTFRVERETR